MIHQYVGWLGAILFAICGLPQAIKTWKTKKANDLSWLFLLFWLFGEILTIIYVITDDWQLKIIHYPLYLNYFFNIILVSYLIYAKKYYK